MKRFILLLSAVLLAALTACSGEPANTGENQGLIPPLQSDAPYDLPLAGAAGQVPAGAELPALCNGAQDSNAASFAAEVISLVNVQRANVGQGALSSQSQLTQAAQKHSIDMGCNLFMSHTGSDGSSPGQRIAAFGYPYAWWGENVAAGQSTPAAVVDAWMNSQPHRENILSPNFTEIGIGYIYNSRDRTLRYYHYWTMALGQPW